MALLWEQAMTARIATALAGCFMLLASASPWAEDSATYPLYAGFALGFASAGLSCDYYGYFYGKAGYMWWDAEYSSSNSTKTSDESGGDFTYGAGFAFTFSPDYDFRIEFERLNELGDDFTHGGAEVVVLYFAGNVNFN